MKSTDIKLLLKLFQIILAHSYISKSNMCQDNTELPQWM